MSDEDRVPMPSRSMSYDQAFAQRSKSDPSQIGEARPSKLKSPVDTVAPVTEESEDPMMHVRPNAVYGSASTTDIGSVPRSPIPEMPGAPKLGRRHLRNKSMASTQRTTTTPSKSMGDLSGEFQIRRRRSLTNTVGPDGVARINLNDDESLLFSPDGRSVFSTMKSKYLKQKSVNFGALFNGEGVNVNFDLAFEDVQVLDRSPEKAYGRALDKIEELIKENQVLKERNVHLGTLSKNLKFELEMWRKNSVAVKARNSSGQSPSGSGLPYPLSPPPAGSSNSNNSSLAAELNTAKQTIGRLKNMVKTMSQDCFRSAVAVRNERGGPPVDADAALKEYEAESALAGEGTFVNPWMWLAEKKK